MLSCWNYSYLTRLIVIKNCLPKADILLALFSGAALVLGFAPFNQWWMGLLCPALLALIWHRQNSPKRCALTGLWFGIGLFACGIYWVFVSIHHYGQAPVAIAAAITALLVIICALPYAIMGWLLKRFFNSQHPTWIWLAFPTLWVLQEWVRSWIFTGFPWLLLGYTQLHSPLSGFAPLGSVYLVSWLTLIMGIAIAQLIKLISANYLNHAAIMAIVIAVVFSVGYSLQQHHFTQPQHTIKTTLVQGNLPPLMKWSPRYIKRAMGIYTQASLRHFDSQLIIWPESALPVLPQQIAPFLASLNHLLAQHDVGLIAGMPAYKNHQFYNAAIGLGNVQGHYYKHHLVPFGEYIPLSHLIGPVLNFLHLPMSSKSSGSDHQVPIMLNHLAISVFICYESAFAQLVRHFAQHSALLVNISDDAWFGHTIGQWQHIEMAQMRTLELQRYMLVATNTGVTGVINPQGQLVTHLPTFTRNSLTTNVQAMSGTTPWQTFGLIPWLVLWISLLIFIIYWGRSNVAKL